MLVTDLARTDGISKGRRVDFENPGGKMTKNEEKRKNIYIYKIRGEKKKKLKKRRKKMRE